MIETECVRGWPGTFVAACQISLVLLLFFICKKNHVNLPKQRVAFHERVDPYFVYVYLPEIHDNLLNELAAAKLMVIFHKMLTIQ